MQNEISYLVSNYDIEAKFNHSQKIKIIVYSDLRNYYSIFDILPYDSCGCFILLRTTNSSAHWTCLVKYKNNIYYFDSYGVKPDGELRRISKFERYELGESKKELTRLINTIPNDYNFSYNKTQLQEYAENVNTCGKYCTSFVYCILKGLTLQQFLQRMKQLKNEYKASYDELICVIYDTI